MMFDMITYLKLVCVLSVLMAGAYLVGFHDGRRKP